MNPTQRRMASRAGLSPTGTFPCSGDRACRRIPFPPVFFVYFFSRHSA